MLGRAQTNSQPSAMKESDIWSESNEKDAESTEYSVGSRAKFHHLSLELSCARTPADANFCSRNAISTAITNGMMKNGM